MPDFSVTAPRTNQFVPLNLVRAFVGLAFAAIASAACDTQATSANPRPRTAVDSAEQVMYNARTLIASNGMRRGEAFGSIILVFDAATRFDFRSLRVQFTTTLGRPLSTLTAPFGVYSVGRGGLDARSGREAVVIASDTSRRRIEVAAGAVRYDPATDQLSSDTAFVATSGSRKLTGVGFTADAGLFRIRCVQRCTGSLGP